MPKIPLQNIEDFEKETDYVTPLRKFKLKDPEELVHYKKKKVKKDKYAEQSELSEGL